MGRDISAIEITTKVGCEISCAYCPQDQFIAAYAKRSHALSLNMDVFRLCIDKIPLSVDIVFAGMCEPFLNPQCAEMIIYAYKKGHQIGVDTTLVGMKLSDVESLELIPFRFFCIHLPSAQHYERINTDENYLQLLKRVSCSNIKAIYHFHGESVHPLVKSLIKNNIEHSYTCTRAGNIKIKNISIPEMKRGRIKCKRYLRWNVLLPNGDVILCSMDYNLQHVIGNLAESDYESLFRSKEYLRVVKGLRYSSPDILCRYCDSYSCETGLSKKTFKDYLFFMPKISNFFRVH